MQNNYLKLKQFKKLRICIRLILNALYLVKKMISLVCNYKMQFKDQILFKCLQSWRFLDRWRQEATRIDSYTDNYNWRLFQIYDLEICFQSQRRWVISRTVSSNLNCNELAIGFWRVLKMSNSIVSNYEFFLKCWRFSWHRLLCSTGRYLTSIALQFCSIFVDNCILRNKCKWLIQCKAYIDNHQSKDIQNKTVPRNMTENLRICIKTINSVCEKWILAACRP